jgi:hypothetical protein
LFWIIIVNFWILNFILVGLFVTDQISDIKEERFVLAPSFIGIRSSWVEGVGEQSLSHHGSQKAEKRTRRGLGQDTPKVLPPVTCFLHLGSPLSSLENLSKQCLQLGTKWTSHWGISYSTIAGLCVVGWSVESLKCRLFNLVGFGHQHFHFSGQQLNIKLSSGITNFLYGF